MSDDKIPDLRHGIYILDVDGTMFQDKRDRRYPTGSVFDGLAQKLCFVCEQWRDANRGPQTCGPRCMESDYPTEEEQS